MAIYSYTKASVDPSQIYNDLGGSLVLAQTPDSIDHGAVTYEGETMVNYNQVVFSFPASLSGSDLSALNTYMASYVGVSSNDDKTALALGYLSNGLQMVAALAAKALIDGKSSGQTDTWFSQLESVINALNAGFIGVALDRLVSVTSTLINILTGSMTTAEVTALRNTMQSLLGLTLT